MIELKDTEFSYTKKGLPALTGITAQVGPGVHLLAGENGAGKTTMLHLIAGVSRPAKGECNIDNCPAASDKPSEKRRTFLLEENMFFPGGTIRDFARMHSFFYPNFSQDRFEENLKSFGLTGEEKMKHQSLGNRKKSQLAYALALGVDVLLLDEPTNALDIQGREVLKAILASTLDDGQIVIVATHNVSELENIYDGCIMISKSILLFAGSAEEISEKLAFRATRMPDSSALYSEIQPGRVAAIYEAQEDEDTRVDWRLFYSSLHSPMRSQIINQLKS